MRESSNDAVDTLVVRIKNPVVGNPENVHVTFAHRETKPGCSFEVRSSAKRALAVPDKNEPDNQKALLSDGNWISFSAYEAEEPSILMLKLEHSTLRPRHAVIEVKVPMTYDRQVCAHEETVAVTFEKLLPRKR
jgi:hypothetical protein